MIDAEMEVGRETVEQSWWAGPPGFFHLSHLRSRTLPDTLVMQQVAINWLRKDSMKVMKVFFKSNWLRAAQVEIYGNFFIHLIRSRK